MQRALPAIDPSRIRAHLICLFVVPDMNCFTGLDAKLICSQQTPTIMADCGDSTDDKRMQKGSGWPC